MANETIKNLLEALQVSPDNVPLRLHVAELMLKDENYEEAGTQFREVLKKSYGNARAQLGLATCYFNTEKYSAALVIYEQLPDKLSVEDRVRYVKCLVKENSLQQAIEVYQKILAVDPLFSDDEIDSYLRMPSSAISEELTEEDFDEDSSYFMEKPKWKFQDVGGMKRVKEEISLKIIQPLTNPDLYKAFYGAAGFNIMTAALFVFADTPYAVQVAENLYRTKGRKYISTHAAEAILVFAAQKNRDVEKPDVGMQDYYAQMHESAATEHAMRFFVPFGNPHDAKDEASRATGALGNDAGFLRRGMRAFARHWGN